MPKKLHLDFEVFSEVDLRDVGAFRYSNDPTTEILCCAFAFDDEEPVIWHPSLDEIDLFELEPYFDALRDPSVELFAHNSMFELAVLLALAEKTWGIPCPDISRFRCTMSLARRAALPAKLETLAETLGLTQKKDSRGKLLIRKFCMMQPAKKPTKKNPNGLPVRRIFPADEPEAFRELLDYCLQDVRVEQQVAKKLAYFNDDLNNANFTLDQKINARGVPVNLKALRHAQKLIDEETAIVSRQFRELTGFEVTQRDVLLKWVNSFFPKDERSWLVRNVEKYGWSEDHLLEKFSVNQFADLQAETIDTFLEKFEGVSDEDAGVVVQALRLKQSIAYASIKKVRTMLDCAGPHDNRIRGMLNYHGAGTGRWTASLVQFQNMKKAVIKHSEDAYRDICAGMSREMIECCYGPVLEVIASCIRHFVDDVKEAA